MEEAKQVNRVISPISLLRQPFSPPSYDSTIASPVGRTVGSDSRRIFSAVTEGDRRFALTFELMWFYFAAQFSFCKPSMALAASLAAAFFPMPLTASISSARKA